jgi:hypothetical protein
MFLTKLKMSATAVFAVGAASLLAIATVELTQTKVKARSSPNAQDQVEKKAGRRAGAPSPQTPPVSPRTQAILSALDQPVSMAFGKATPIDDVLKYIKQATTTPTFSGLPFYVDPLGLQEAKRTLNSTVTISAENSPLRVTLPQVLAQLGLAYIVKDDFLMISSPKEINRERKETVVLAADAAPETKAVLAQLDEPISMSFANETPLSDVLEYITQATASPDSSGILILVHPPGLKEVKRSIASTVTMDLEGLPLKTTLRLLLKQLGLAYVVKDGLLVISSTKGIQLFGKADSEPRNKVSGKN